MTPGIWNMVFGAVFVAMGLSGRFTLAFTNSQWALVAVGAAIAGWGVVQFVRHRKRSGR